MFVWDSTNHNRELAWKVYETENFDLVDLAPIQFSETLSTCNAWGTHQQWRKCRSDFSFFEVWTDVCLVAQNRNVLKQSLRSDTHFWDLWCHKQDSEPVPKSFTTDLIWQEIQKGYPMDFTWKLTNFRIWVSQHVTHTVQKRYFDCEILLVYEQ